MPSVENMAILSSQQEFKSLENALSRRDLNKVPKRPVRLTWCNAPWVL